MEKAACHHADSYLGMGIDKSTAQAVPVKITDQYQVSVRKAARHGGDFIVIDPQGPPLE